MMATCSAFQIVTEAIPFGQSSPVLSSPRSFLCLNNLQTVRWRWSCWSSPLRAVPDRSRFQVADSRRNRNAFRRSSLKTKKVQQDEGDEDDLSDDAFEALFSQLEKDLAADQISDDEEDDAIIDEEAARFEEELQAVLSDLEDDEEAGASLLDAASTLETWQLQKLAAALELGRRKISVKSLAEELGLDRARVLDLLRDPPPELLLAGGTLPEKDSVVPLESESKPLENTSPNLAELEGPKNKVEAPVYITQRGRNGQKRMKKVHIATLEKVYRRTRRPTPSTLGLPNDLFFKQFDTRLHTKEEEKSIEGNGNLGGFGSSRDR